MSYQMLDAIGATSPYRIPDHIKAVKLVIMSPEDNVPAKVEAMMSSSPTKFGLRIAGGCSNMSEPDRAMMLYWFGENLGGFRGFVSSGATREVNNLGLVDPMVTEVPTLLAAAGNVVAISTVPRVGDLELVDDSRLRMYREDKWGESVSAPNPGVHMIVIVQSRIGDELDWDGDVTTYVNLFNNRRKYAGWQFACIAWNGGGVTMTEIKLTARSGWPVILVEGSGRGADECIVALRNGTLDLSLDGEGPVPYDPAQHKIYVVSKDQPYSLQQQLAALSYPV
jgi:hypothetical protein